MNELEEIQNGIIAGLLLLIGAWLATSGCAAAPRRSPREACVGQPYVHGRQGDGYLANVELCFLENGELRWRPVRSSIEIPQDLHDYQKL